MFYNSQYWIVDEIFGYKVSQILTLIGQ